MDEEHSVDTVNKCNKNSIPKGGTIVATVHTHPNSSFVSGNDMMYAKFYKLDSYIVVPNGYVKYFYWKDVTNVKNKSYKAKLFTCKY